MFMDKGAATGFRLSTRYVQNMEILTWPKQRRNNNENKGRFPHGRRS
jgi:hypothetical protein